MKHVLEAHTLSSVWEGHCDYGAEVSCACNWSGDPSDYTEHLLVMLGQTSTRMQKWIDEFVPLGGDLRGYQDIYDQPSIVKARKSVEAKVRKEEKRLEKLRRMAANGDKEAKEKLSASS